MGNGKDNGIIFDRNIIASAHINFLFGAGVNGKALTQLKNFHSTIRKVEELGKDVSQGLENGIDQISDPRERDEVKTTFVREFKQFADKVDPKAPSICNLENLLRKAYSIVQAAQNRVPSMKQINIYTLNYDTIVEETLSRLGYFYNAISASNTNTKAPLMHVIGYDYTSEKYIPSFMISKLHGDIKRPILPGKEKYKEMLNEDYFEIAFNMKQQLCRPNSILIVIGYSGCDNHINKLLQDCINSGLLIYWYLYDNTEKNKISLSDDNRQIKIRSQNSENKEDTTKLCFDDLEAAWAEKSEKL